MPKGSQSNWQVKVLLPAAAFGFTALVLCAVFGICGLFPFGNKTLAWGDMTQQVIPLMLEFRDILTGDADFLLNLQNAGGMSFWGVFFFFLSSPFSFLVLFCKKEEIYFLVNTLVLIKLCLASTTAAAFFRYENPKGSLGLRVILSVSYGLCGYGLLYYQNLVWLDILYLFPLVMLSFLKLVREGKVWPFSLALGCVIICNYYLSYMVFLALLFFSVLFLIWQVPKGKRGETAGKIGCGAAAALLLTAVVWLPSLAQCFRSARTDQGLAASLQDGGFFADLYTTLPTVLCTAPLLCIPFLFGKGRLTTRQKPLIVMTTLTLIPLIVEPVNKLWHTGSYQAFPTRYGYLPVFFGLWCLAVFLEKGEEQAIEKRSKKLPVLAVFTGISIASGLGFFLIRFRFFEITNYNRTLWVDKKSFWALFCFSFCTAFVVWLASFFRKTNRISQKAFLGAFGALVFIQGVYHGMVYFAPTANDAKNGKALLAVESPQAPETLYRAKLAYKFANVNQLGAAGYATLNHYTSLTDSDYLHAVKKLGYSSYWMETSGCCGTEVSDILLSNKYVLDRSLRWSLTASGTLGYLLPSKALPEKIPGGNRVEAQERLYRQIVGESAFQKYQPASVTGAVLLENTVQVLGKLAVISYEIPIEEEETLYFDAFGENTNRLTEPINEKFQVVVNGEAICEKYPTQGCNGILELGTFCEETARVQIRIFPIDGLTSFGVYGLPAEKSEKLAGCLRNGRLRQRGNTLIGTAKAENGNTSLFLSIPYSPGMKATVNGERAAVRKVLDCFLEIPLKQGENEIVFSYFPTELVMGIVLTSFGVLTALVIFFGRKKRAFQALKNLWQKIAWRLLAVTAGAAFLFIYLAPVAVWLLGK